jgi:glycosyltransferase involved in cell wall biosynthesis
MMRVLHLPNNIASQITVTVQALRDIGIQARGLASAGVITSNSVIEPLSQAPTNQRLQWLIAGLQRRVKILTAIQWADIVHWHFHWGMYGALDVRWAKLLKKKRAVTFWGSDIRIPEIEMADNPYYAAAYPHSEYKTMETLKSSRRNQAMFASLQTTALIPDGQMCSYLQRDLFPTFYHVRQSIYLSDYEPMFPAVSKTRPIIIHSPSASVMKGTPAVMTAIAQLQAIHSFDFQRLQGVPHSKAKRIMQACDIFVDQFVLGAHGLAALEAMAFGKPVVCYIKPALQQDYPPELPIVVATQETLPDVLARLLDDGKLRRELGEQGRAYVEKYHDAHKIAQQLLDIYRSL